MVSCGQTYFKEEKVAPVIQNSSTYCGFDDNQNA